MLVAVRREVVVDLPAAQQNLGDLRSLVIGVKQDRLEGSGRELVRGGDRLLGAQERLWGEDDQRSSQTTEHLPAQKVEVRRRGAWHRHRHVVLSAHLQEALDARTRVVRPLPFLPVRQ